MAVNRGVISCDGRKVGLVDFPGHPRLRDGLGAALKAAKLLVFVVDAVNTEDDRALLAIAPGVAFFALGARSLMSAGD